MQTCRDSVQVRQKKSVQTETWCRPVKTINLAKKTIGAASYWCRQAEAWRRPDKRELVQADRDLLGWCRPGKTIDFVQARQRKQIGADR